MIKIHYMGKYFSHARSIPTRYATIKSFTSVGSGFFCTILLLLLNLSAGTVAAQGFIFSNHDRMMGFYNPAFNASDNFMELNAIHRIQSYAEGLQVNTTGIDLSRPIFDRFKTKRMGGVGLSIMQESLNNDSPYRKITASASYAYNLPIYKKQYLSFGAQLSFNQLQFSSTDNYITGSQWVSNFGYDPSMPIGESLSSVVDAYFGVGTGLLWYMEDDLGRIKYTAGVSAFNLNQPELQFTAQSQKIPVMYGVQLAGEIFRQGNHQLFLEAISSFDKNMQLGGLGPRWTYHFANMDPFDPFTSGELSAFAKYYNEGRISLGSSISQKNFSFAFSMDFFTNNSYQNTATEFGLSIIKKLHLTKTKEAPEISETGYQIGTERDFSNNENINLEKEPVEKIEKAYQQTSVEGNFSFELSVNFNFEFNDTSLNEEAKTYLKDIFFMLQSNPALKLMITGHTDNVGSGRANRKVSAERAENVMDYLVELGISKDRMKAIGKGDSEPLLPNNTESNRAKNRRVEFLIFAEKN
ncbi:OmpA family protein [Marivirga sp. S37H4]|uniref:OmpA family protein n=1 Tax=Marivirga aurantiaca TaxID=2802615 RepID=A0A934WXK6_9BACT|nr:OmpA family protein [Marivirga aurantiaca]MBK6264767.1 OmpA family protein [Marivirga aurantiaca]